MLIQNRILLSLTVLTIGMIFGVIVTRKWCPTVVTVEKELPAPDPIVKLVNVEPKGTLIGKGCSIEGKLTVDVVAIAGKVTGEVNTKEATINGVVEGPINAEMVTVEPSANIKGDITSKGFEFKNGASYVGNLRIGTGEAINSPKKPINTTQSVRKKLEDLIKQPDNEIELPSIKFEHINTKPKEELQEIHIHVDNRPIERSNKAEELPIKSSSKPEQQASSPSSNSTKSNQSITEIRPRDNGTSNQSKDATPRGLAPSERQHMLISASDLVDLSWQVVKDTPEYKSQLKSALNWESKEDNLYAKLVSASGAAKSGKIEDLKRFFYVLALYKDCKCDPPSVVAELTQKNKKEFDELCSNWSWEAASATVMKLLK